MKTTTKAVILVVLMMMCSARGQNQDSSVVSNKLMHAGGGAGISLITGYSTGKPWLGLASGCGVGVAKEVHDHAVSNESFGSNVRDVAVTCGAATISYFLVKKMIKSDRRHKAVPSR